MSQKVKHPPKSPEESASSDFKAPEPEKIVENGTVEQKDQKKQSAEQKDAKKHQTEQKDSKKSSKSSDSKEANEINGQDKEMVNGSPDKRTKRSTRSRSKTPHKRKADDNISIDKSIPEVSISVNNTNGIQAPETNGQSCSESGISTNGDDSTQMSDKVEMEALILNNDEPEPELQFDESSDFSESGKASPVISRCKTRRSQTRNIPTPKTPKLHEENDTEKSNKKSEENDKEKATRKTPEHTDSDTDTPPKKLTRSRVKKQAADTDDDSVASDNLSTRAEAGNDSTRLDFMNQDSGLPDENSFLSTVKDRSLGETLRGLSPRKSIRQGNVDYRKQVLKGNLEKNDHSYLNHNRITGMKRKNRSLSPEDAKRAKLDAPGIFTRITSPLLGMRNKFRTDLASSTPKLTGYKNKDSFENDNISQIVLYGEDDQGANRKWCSIM